jgi:hypothetical protein
MAVQISYMLVIMAILEIMVFYHNKITHLDKLLVLIIVIQKDSLFVKIVGDFFVVMMIGLITIMPLVLILWTLFILLI